MWVNVFDSGLKRMYWNSGGMNIINDVLPAKQDEIVTSVW